MTRSTPFIVAIDGGAASGKSSTARGVAERLELLHVDTGAHYRAVTWWCLQAGLGADQAAEVSAFIDQLDLGTMVIERSARIVVNGRLPPDSALRSAEVNAAVSHFAALPGVRRAVFSYQRSQVEVAREHGFPGLVVEGRDIGSVIFPDADRKFFLEADAGTRALRRALDGQADAVAERDAIDSGRVTAPLTCAPDAVRIDTSHLSLAEVIERLVSICRGETGHHPKISTPTP